MAKVEVRAKLMHLRMSPRKVRAVTDLICGLSVEAAVVQLEHMTKSARKPVLKLLQSAVANAKHNHNLKDSGLKVKQIIVNGGPILYRWMPRAMGRATPIRKRSAHIEVVLQGEEPEEKTKRIEKNDKKASNSKV